MKKNWFSCMILLVFSLILSFPTSSSASGFDQVKEGSYTPLSPYTLNWSGDVLVNGGMNLTKQTYTTTSVNTDFVITASQYIGAKAIVELGATHDLKSAIDKSSYTGKWQTYTDLKLTTYLIRTHTNDYAKIKITDILPNEVSFEYVIESLIEEDPNLPTEPVPEDKPINQWPTPKENISPAHKWTVKFSKPVRVTTVHANNIYVLSSKGIKLDTKLELSADKKNVYVYAPNSNYTIGETYTLIISHLVSSESTHQSLENNIHMDFTIGEKETEPINPAAPSGLTGTPLNEKVSLTWYSIHDPSFLGYNIYMSEGNNENFKLYKYLDVSEAPFVPLLEIPNLKNNVPYYFYVTAVYKNQLESGRSNVISVTPTSAYASGWTGTWSSTYGMIEFTQSGSSLSGTYGANGTITGEIQGNTFTGKYHAVNGWYVDSGDIILTLSNDGRSFTGKWKIDNGINWGTWNGDKILSSAQQIK